MALTLERKDKIRLQGIAYREANKERIRAYKTSEEYKANRRVTRDLAKNREECRAYYQRNIEKLRLKKKEWIRSPEGQAYTKSYRKEAYAKGGIERGRKKVQEVELRYARELLVRDSNLKGIAIPIELIKAKQAEIKLKRLINEIAPPEKKKAIAKAEKRALTIQRRVERAPINKERRKALARARYHNNLEKAREKNLKYREKNREVVNAKMREIYHANKEEINAKRRNISPEERAHINALAREATARRKLNQQESRK